MGRARTPGKMSDKTRGNVGVVKRERGREGRKKVLFEKEPSYILDRTSR